MLFTSEPALVIVTEIDAVHEVLAGSVAFESVKLPLVNETVPPRQIVAAFGVAAT
jgi:hypothetical protein